MLNLRVLVLACSLSMVGGGLAHHSLGHSARAIKSSAHTAQDPPITFPRTPAHMAALLQPSQTANVLAEAWAHFQQLTSGGSLSWENWDTKCTLGLTPQVGICKFYAAIQKPAGGNISRPVSSIFYNPSAATSITENHLASGKVLATLIKNGNAGIPGTDFTSDAVVIKEIWEGFNDDGRTLDMPMGVKVYDAGKVQPLANALPPITSWPSTLAFALTPQGALDRNVPCADRPYKTTESGTSDPVPLQCFSFRSSNGEPCYKLAVSAPVRLPIGVYDANRPCTLVLVGLQLITKEIDQWTWTAFWWTNVAHTADRPSDLPPAFWHFAMKTMIDPRVTTPIFNPYLEGPHLGGTQSNCLTCHSHAAFTPTCTPPLCPRTVGDRIGISNPEAAPIDKKLKHCNAGDTNIANRCQLQTSFLWSLATNQDRESREIPKREPGKAKNK